MNEQKIIKQAEDRITANAYIHYVSDLIYKKTAELGLFEGADFEYHADIYENISVFKFKPKHEKLVFDMRKFLDDSMISDESINRAIKRIFLKFKINNEKADSTKTKLYSYIHTSDFRKGQISDEVNYFSVKRRKNSDSLNVILYFHNIAKELTPLATCLLRYLSLILDQILYTDNSNVFLLGNDTYSDFLANEDFYGLQKEVFYEKPLQKTALEQNIQDFKSKILHAEIVHRIYKQISGNVEISDELLFDNCGYIVDKSYWTQIKETQIQNLLQDIKIELELIS
ncbi:hypothetical protein HG462_002055 [Candidatus Saccharibacteria bacterium]|nr:hypothetical protein [Candidatus Saccharibacteria bacterium]